MFTVKSEVDRKGLTGRNTNTTDGKVLQDSIENTAIMPIMSI